MRNKKLIPFETIEKAVAGEPEAIDTVLRSGEHRHSNLYRLHQISVLLSREYQRRYSRPSESTAYQSYPAIPI